LVLTICQSLRCSTTTKWFPNTRPVSSSAV
jgi:hypothetical protein